MLSELNKLEKSILIELTDFNTSIRQVVIDIHFENESLSVGDKFNAASDAIYRLYKFGLISIQKNQYIEDKSKELVLKNSLNLSETELVNFLKHPANWMTEHGLEDDSIIFELAPTEKGEKVLDAIFKISEKT